MKNELKDVLNITFSAPEPKKKQMFLKNLRPSEISTLEMLCRQAGYIRGTVWIFAAAVIVFVLFGSWKQLPDTQELVPEIMPFLAAVSVLENRRSRKYGMIELEMVTRFSFKSVLFARMLIPGITCLVILAVASPVIAMAFGGETLLTAMHMLIPYLVTMSICLQVERSPLGRRLEYGSLAAAALISVLMIWIKNYAAALVNGYAEMIRDWGVLIVLILAMVTAFEQWRTLNSTEEPAWNYQ